MSDEFDIDGAIDELAKPAPTPEPPAANTPPTGQEPAKPAAFDMDAAVDGLAKTRAEDDQLNAQFLRYRQQNASMPGDQQAEVFRTAAALRTMGETPDLDYVAKNLDPLKKRVDAHGAKWDQLLNDHPGLKDYLLEKPQRTELVSDDLANVDGIAWALKVPGLVFKKAVAEQEYFGRTFAESKGLGSDANRAAIKALEPDVEAGYGAEHWYSKMYAGTLNMLPMLARYAGAGAAGGWLGGAAAALPALGGAAATPELLGAGGVVTEAAGVAAGVKLATGTLTYYETVGPAYQRMIRQGVRPAIAHALAEGEAVTTAAIFAGAMPGMLAKLGIGPKAITGELGAETAKVLEQKALPQILSKAATQWGKNVGHAALMMGAVGAVSQTTDEVAGWLDHGQTPDVKRIAAAVGNSMVAAVRDMSIISAFAPAREAFSNIGESVRLGQEQEQLEEAIKGAEESKLLERSPDEFKALFATLGQSGLKKLYSPIDDFKAYWEARRANPRDVAAKLAGDDGAAYDHAVQTGGDLPMPAENYLAVLGKTEHARGLAQDVKIRPDGNTPRQEQKRVERRAEELAKIPDADIRMEKGRDLLADNLRRDLERAFAGNKRIANPEAVAEKTAKLQADAFHRMAEEINKNANEGTEPITALELYKEKVRLELVGQKGVRAGDIAPEAYADPAVLPQLDQHLSDLDVQGRMGAYYLDRNTGLHNDIGSAVAPVDETNPNMAMFSFEGKKPANDLVNHMSVDGALRIMGRVLGQEKITSGAKRGGNIVAPVDQARADELAALMSQAIDPSGRVKVRATSVPRESSLDATMEKLSAAHEKRKGSARTALPAGYADNPADFIALASKWAKQAEGDAAPVSTITPEHVAHFADVGPEQSRYQTFRESHGLLNELGHKRAIELAHPAHVMAGDLRGIGALNDAIGQSRVNDILDVVLNKWAEKGGGEINAARPHGDELGASGNDEGRIRDIADGVKEALNQTIFWGKAEDGRFFYQKGLDLDYDVSSDELTAESALRAEKAKRTEFAKPEFVGDEDELDRKVEELERAGAAEGSIYTSIEVGRGSGAADRRVDSEASGGAGSEAGRAAGQQADEVRRDGAAVAGGKDNGGGVPPETVGGPGPDATAPARASDAAVQGNTEARPGEVALGSDTPTTKAARGVVFHKTDSTTLPRAWSHWDGYQHVMETIGGSDASPSEQADGKYRAYLNKKTKVRPSAFGGGGFEQVNNELDRTGRGEGVSGALEAWVELNKKFKTGLRWENMQRVIDAMRTVPGLERLRLPEEVETRQALARLEGDQQAEHGVTSDPVKLEQPGKDGPRGSISFEMPRKDGKPRRYEMNLDGADESTAAHESFHMLTEVLHDVATAADAPKSLKDDYQALIKWMGHASPEERVAATKERITLEREKAKGTITPSGEQRRLALEAKEERAAAGWEQYLLEGKSPSARLADVFSRFGGWLAKIYRGGAPAQQFESSYGEQLGLTPEVKAIFDRLLASETQLDATKNALEMQPLPAAHRGMTPEEKQEYADATEQMQADARTAMVKALAGDKRVKSHIVDEERQRLTEERNTELDRTPVYRALSFLQDRELIQVDDNGDVLRIDPPSWLIDPATGKTYRLDRKNVDSMLGKGGWKTLPAGATDAKGGIAAGELAEFLGFDSAEAMVRALQVAEPRDAVVKRDVQAKLNEVFGPALIDNPTALFEEALSAEHNDAAARRIMIEQRSLRRQLNKDIDPRLEIVSEKASKGTARRLIDEKRIDELSPGYYRRAEKSAAKRALEAAVAGKLDKAMGERDTQLLNHYLYRYAREAKEQADHIREQLQKKNTDTYRAGLGKAVYEEKRQDGTVVRHREYLDAHDAIMAAIGIGTRRPQDFKFDDLLARMDLDAAEVGFDVGAVRDILGSGKLFGDLTTPQAAEIDAAIKNIRQSANAVREILVDGQRTTVKSWVDRIREDLERRPNLGKAPSDKTQVGVLKKASLKVQAADGGLLDIDTIAEMLGPTAGEFIVNRFIEARGVKNALADRVLPKVLEAFNEMPSSMRDRRNEVLSGLDQDLPISEDLNEEGPRSRQWLWMAFLNMGNRGPKSNAERLTKPYGWTEDQVTVAIGKHLTAAECGFLQKILDLTDKELWPEVSAKEERKLGLAPEKIKASPIEVTFADGTKGTYAGGYFPAKYKRDVAIGDIAERQDASIQSIYGPNYERASTAKGHTQARAAGYANVLDLNWNVVTNHLAQVIHDVAYDEYIRDTARVVMHPELRDAIFQRFGEKRSAQLNDWLKTVAREHIDSVPESMRGWQEIINPMRLMMVAGAVGGSIPVMMANLTDAGFAITNGEMSFRHGLPAIAKGFLQAPLMPFGTSEMRNKAIELCPEIRHRAAVHARSVRDFELRAIGKNQSKFARTKERLALMMGSFMEAADAISSTQTFWGAFNDAKAAGLDEQAAITKAGNVIRATLVSHERAQQSAFVRDKIGPGAVSVFYGWYNKRYNGVRRAADRAYVARENEDALGGTVATAKAAGYILATAALAGTVTELMGGRGKQDDESTWQWALRKSIAQFMSLVPWGGMAAPLADLAVTGSFKPPSEMAPPGLTMMHAAITEVGKAIASGDSSDKAALALKAAVGAALVGARLPVRQLARTGGYIVKLVDGDAEDTSPAGVASGLMYGERQNQPANPFRPMGR